MSGVTADNNNVNGGFFIKVTSSGSVSYRYKFIGATGGNDQCSKIVTNGDGRIVFIACTSYATSYSTLGAAYIVKVKGTDGSLVKVVRLDGDNDD